MNNNSVIFKGKNDGIVILLDEKEDFNDIKIILEDKVTKAKNFFNGANISITFKGRNISEKEEEELLGIISKKSGINISYVNDFSDDKKMSFRPTLITAALKNVANKLTDENIKNIENKEDKENKKENKKENEENDTNENKEKSTKTIDLKNIDIHTVSELPKKENKQINKTKKKPLDNMYSHIMFNNTLNVNENMTSFHKGSIRSGQELHFRGSIVIIGDVNPGAKIKAGGNVIVLGSLKGFVHAGVNGNSECFIVALSMRPTVIKINNAVKYFSKELIDKKISPKYAYIESGEICIQTLLNS